MTDTDGAAALPETTAANHKPHLWRPGQSGNPSGRPRGSRHTALVALDAIGEAGAKQVLQAVVNAASGGDMRAADILLRRVWPERKGRAVALDLPKTDTAEGVMQAQARIVQAVSEGNLSADEAHAISAVLEGMRKSIESHDLEARIAVLEAKQGAKP
jgi:hypothetical protein